VAVTVKHQGRIDLDLSGMLDFAVSIAVGDVQRRVRDGVDLNGSAFAPYSPGYEQKLSLMGESTDVDLTVTGAYIASIGERSRTVTATGASAVIGPGTGTSMEVRPLADARERINRRIGHDLTGSDPAIEKARARADKRLNNDLKRIAKEHARHMQAIEALGRQDMRAEAHRMHAAAIAEARTRHAHTIDRAHKSFHNKTKLTASRTGGRSPPHNVLGALLHYGTEKMPARSHLGLTDQERKAIAEKLVRLKQG
jgi:hypothetical protein